MPELVELCGVRFRFIDRVEVRRDQLGAPVEFRPYRVADGPAHIYGQGPFCEFDVAADVEDEGVYCLQVAGRPVYVGETVNLARRFGGQGYGRIESRDCVLGGPTTNCRVNSEILSATKRHETVELWFHKVHGRLKIEDNLLKSLEPVWNKRLGSPIGGQVSRGDWRQVTRQAREAGVLFGRDWRQGQAAFHGLLKRYPLDGMVYYERGLALQRDGRLLDAIVDLGRAQVLFPQEIWRKRAGAAVEQTRQKIGHVLEMYS